MTGRHDTMMNPRIEELLERAGSKFSLVTLGAKRARQINSYFNQLGEGLGAIVPPQVTSVSRKPLSIALEEVAAGKIPYERIDADRPLSGKRVVLGVSGGIAAYKAVELCRRLVDAGAFVSPVLTDDVTRF